MDLHKQKTKNTRMKKRIPMRVHEFHEGPFTPVVKWWSTVDAFSKIRDDILML